MPGNVATDLPRLIQALAAAVHLLESETAQTPNGVQHFLSDRLGDACRDTAGWLLEAAQQSEKLTAESAKPTDTARRLRRLEKVQQLFERARREIEDNISADRVVADFQDLAKRKPDMWAVWVRTIRRQQSRIQRLSYDVVTALAQCWQHIAQQSPIEVQIKTVAIRRR
jgi:hypothetical protein